MKISNALLAEVLATSESGQMAGFCVACGRADPHLVHSDARELRCEHCGEDRVFGISAILVMAAAAIVRKMYAVAGAEKAA